MMHLSERFLAHLSGSRSRTLRSFNEYFVLARYLQPGSRSLQRQANLSFDSRDPLRNSSPSIVHRIPQVLHTRSFHGASMHSD
jgi:hypothetical protein